MSNRPDPGMEPPETPLSRKEIEREERQADFEEEAIKFVKENIDKLGAFDFYEHDKEVAIPFAEWCSRSYDMLTEGHWRKRAGSWNKKTSKGWVPYTTKQLWEIYCNQSTENK